MGIALAKKDGTCVVVACYHPRGNIVGQFTENVLKPIKLQLVQQTDLSTFVDIVFKRCIYNRAQREDNIHNICKYKNADVHTRRIKKKHSTYYMQSRYFVYFINCRYRDCIVLQLLVMIIRRRVCIMIMFENRLSF